MTLTPQQQALWANEVTRACLLEAGDDVDAALTAAGYILSTQPVPDRIPGGMADSVPDEEFDPKELAKGILVELEHTDDFAIAKEIAKDHLTEDKDYYKKLIKAGLSHIPSIKSINAYFAHDIHNREAQGILNRTLKTARGMTAAAKRDLAAALNKPNSGAAILEFVDKYRLQLARILTATQLAALLQGAREVAAKVPDQNIPIEGLSVAEQERILATRAEPFALPEPAATAKESGDEIHFPIIDEAVKGLSERGVLTRAEYDELDAAARAKAFTVANVAAEETLAKIRDSLAENIREGADYETWSKAVLQDVDEGTFMSDAHQETVFRTNVQTAFSDGQMSVLSHPLVRSGFPYSTYDSIHDDRARKEHNSLDAAGIAGTNIYRNDDPVFQLFRPPWDYNCVLPGNNVSGQIIGALKSFYSGYAVEILTANGAVTTLTIHHPVLTEDGFVPAGQLKKGYNLLCHLGKRERLRCLDNVQHSPSLIEDVFESIQSFHHSEPLEAFDFDGDEKFMVGKVNVISTYLPLCKLVTSQFESKDQIGFIPTNNGRMKRVQSLDSLFVSHSNPFKSFGITAVADSHITGHQSTTNRTTIYAERQSNGVLGLTRYITSNNHVVINDKAMPDCYRLGLASELDTVFSQPTPNGIAFNPNITSELLEGFPGKVSLSKVVNVRHFWYSGPVYDLETIPGYFTTNRGGSASIIIRNCRCGWTPLTVRQAAERGIKEAQEWLSTGVEPADKAFVPMPPFQPPEGFKRAVASAPLSIQLSMQPMGKFTSGMQATTVPKQPAPHTRWSKDEYPRDNSNRFLDKYTIATAANDQDVFAELHGNIPETEQPKLDRTVARLRAGETIHHPDEHPGLGINMDGVIADPKWAEYQEQLAVYEEWCDRDTLRDEAGKLLNKAVKLVRKDAFDPDEVDPVLEEAGATAAEMRALGRARHRTKNMSEDTRKTTLAEIYEDAIEVIFKRIEAGVINDPEPPEPVEPQSELTAAFSTGSDNNERIRLIAEILTALFDDKASTVAEKLFPNGVSLSIALALPIPKGARRFGKAKPPSSWVLVYTSPRGTPYYMPPGRGAAQQTPPATPQPTAAAPPPKPATAQPPATPAQSQPAPQPQPASAQQGTSFLPNGGTPDQIIDAAINGLAAGKTLQPQDKLRLAGLLPHVGRDKLKALHKALGAGGVHGTKAQIVAKVTTTLTGGAATPSTAPQPPKPAPATKQPTPPPPAPPVPTYYQPPPPNLAVLGTVKPYQDPSVSGKAGTTGIPRNIDHTTISGFQNTNSSLSTDYSTVLGTAPSVVKYVTHNPSGYKVMASWQYGNTPPAGQPGMYSIKVYDGTGQLVSTYDSYAPRDAAYVEARANQVANWLHSELAKQAKQKPTNTITAPIAQFAWDFAQAAGIKPGQVPFKLDDNSPANHAAVEGYLKTAFPRLIGAKQHSPHGGMDTVEHTMNIVNPANLRTAGLSQRDAEILKLGMIFHDVGKQYDPLDHDHPRKSAIDAEPLLWQFGLNEREVADTLAVIKWHDAYGDAMKAGGGPKETAKIAKLAYEYADDSLPPAQRKAEAHRINDLLMRAWQSDLSSIPGLTADPIPGRPDIKPYGFIHVDKAGPAFKAKVAADIDALEQHSAGIKALPQPKKPPQAQVGATRPNLVAPGLKWGELVQRADNLPVGTPIAHGATKTPPPEVYDEARKNPDLNYARAFNMGYDGPTGMVINVYHGSKAQFAGGILSTGIRPGNSGDNVFGHGIYTVVNGTSSVPSAYNGGALVQMEAHTGRVIDYYELKNKILPAWKAANPAEWQQMRGSSVEGHMTAAALWAGYSSIAVDYSTGNPTLVIVDPARVRVTSVTDGKGKGITVKALHGNVTSQTLTKDEVTTPKGNVHYVPVKNGVPQGFNGNARTK